jgi:hypothetical protein
MTKLFSSIHDNLWEQKIFQHLIELLMKVVYLMPKFAVTPAQPINAMQTITNESYVHLCRSAYKAYCVDENYHTAVEFLRHLLDISSQIPSFDRLVFDYLTGITEKYEILLAAYEIYLDREVEDKAPHIFERDLYKTWLAAKNGFSVYEKLKKNGRNSKEIKKKTVWLNILSQNKEQMEFTLYSGKK